MDKHIIKDFKTIETTLGSNFSSIHLFGSYSKGSPTFNDIDVMIRVKKRKNSIKVLRELNNLNIPISRVAVGGYDYYPRPEKDTYDIVIVSDDMLDSYFYKRNLNNFVQV